MAKRVHPCVIVVDTYPYPGTRHGGTLCQVGVPEDSERADVRAAHADFGRNKQTQQAD